MTKNIHPKMFTFSYLARLCYWTLTLMTLQLSSTSALSMIQPMRLSLDSGMAGSRA